MGLRELLKRIRRWRPKVKSRPARNKRPQGQAAVHGYPFLDDEELRRSIYGEE
ncbi:MAG: hypothetical protein AB1791_07150 [Chloroflexota bacterium]